MLAPTLTQTGEVLRLCAAKDQDSSGPVWQFTPPPSLVDLPPELLTAICLFADWKTILGCRSVCRRLKEVIDGSVELQYRIELALDGMIDGPPSSLSPGERLAQLRSLRRSWSTLSWTSRKSIPMPGPCCAYELVGGIFCKTQPARSRNTESSGAGGHLHTGHTVGSKEMSVTWLPSAHDAGRTVVRDDMGIPTRDFAMDPSQDLMVLFRGGEDSGLPMVVVFPGALELHVRTLSTNQTHPEARVPVLCTPVLFPVTSAFIQIVDDVVGMMYCVDPARPRITIWNWKTGNLLVDRSSSHLPHGTWDFSFINNRSFFITSGSGAGSIEIFTFSSSSPSSQSPDQQSSTDPVDPLTHIASLHLPPILPTVRVLSIGTHTGPFLSTCPPGKPFTASNRDRIHVLTLQYINLPTLEGPRSRPRLCMILHNKVLEGYIARAGCLGGSPGGVRSGGGGGGVSGGVAVPWEDWGRANTRVLPHVGLFQWLRYVHGQRFVILPHGSEPGKSILQVLDFNVRDTSTREYVQDYVDAGGNANANANVNTNSSAHANPDSNSSANGDANANANANSSTNVNANTSIEPVNANTSIELINFPTRIGMPNIFSSILETTLPFWETRREVCEDYSGVMIDDERLVGLKYPAFLTGDMKEIDVFMM